MKKYPISLLLYGALFFVGTGCAKIPTAALSASSTSTEKRVTIEDSWNENTAVSTARKTMDDLSWKRYLSSDLQFSIQYPPNWGIREDGKNGVIFSTGIPESHESIAFQQSTSSLEEWINSLRLDPAAIIGKEHVLLDGMPGIRIDTTEFGRTIIVAEDIDPTRYPGKGFYVVETGGRMIENGMLNTLKTTIPYFTKNIYTPTSTSATNPNDATLGDKIQMSADPEWKRIEMDHFSVELPYSADWTIEGNNVLPFDTSGGNPLVLDFGKYINAGTYFAREYQLRLKYETGNSQKAVTTPPNNTCVQALEPGGRLMILPQNPGEMTAGQTRGINYLFGGPNGCDTVYAFTGLHISGEIHKSYPIGQGDPDHHFVDGMRRIIESIEAKK